MADCGCPSVLNVPSETPIGGSGCLNCVSGCCGPSLCPPPNVCEEWIIKYKCGGCYNSFASFRSFGGENLVNLLDSDDFGAPPDFHELNDGSLFSYGMGSFPFPCPYPPCNPNCPYSPCSIIALIVRSNDCVITEGLISVGDSNVTVIGGFLCGAIPQVNHGNNFVPDGGSINITFTPILPCCDCRLESIESACEDERSNLVGGYWKTKNDKMYFDTKQFVKKVNSIRRKKILKKVIRDVKKRGYNSRKIN